MGTTLYQKKRQLMIKKEIYSFSRIGSLVASLVDFRFGVLRSNPGAAHYLIRKGCGGSVVYCYPPFLREPALLKLNLKIQ